MTSPFLFRHLAPWISVTSALAFIALAARSSGSDAVARMEEAVQREVASEQFTGAVLVAKKGGALFDRAYGLANREWDIANTPATHFRIGSITKQFTAVAILVLEERGQLKLTDPVSVHLADAPAAWSKITLHHLLTHTSGLSNVTSDPEFFLWKRLPATVTQMVGRFRDLPLDFPAGERHAYSNSNYLVLGLIVEKVSGGQRFGDFLREQVLDPLGLNDSGLDVNHRILPRRAAGYERSGDKIFNAPYSDMSVPHAAGAMYSTTHDLWRWATAVFHDKLITPASRAKLLTPGKDNYALGVRVNVSHGRKVIEHGGNIAGFSSYLAHYPDDDLTVVVLANQETRIAAELAGRLAAAAFGEPDGSNTARTPVTLPLATLERYVGVYELRAGLRNSIRLTDGQLTTQLTGQRVQALLAESETKFFLKDVNAQIEFIRDGSGRVTDLVMYQHGRSRKVPRVAD
jgi:CubicO group peptidase (beta-lactamase class C family)